MAVTLRPADCSARNPFGMAMLASPAHKRLDLSPRHLTIAVRRPARPHTNQSAPTDMRTLILSRESKKKLPKRLDPVKMRRIERKAELIGDRHGLLQQFLDVKYARLIENVLCASNICTDLRMEYQKVWGAISRRLEAAIENSHSINGLLEHEFCKIAFRNTSAWEVFISQVERRIREMERHIWEVQHSSLVRRLEFSEKIISGMRHLLEQDYLGPRRSARGNIDSLINTSTEIVRQYQELRAIGTNANDGITEIRSLCLGIIRGFRPDDSVLIDITTRLISHIRLFTGNAHAYRSDWFANQRRRHPLTTGELWQWRDFKRQGRVWPEIDVLEALVLEEKVVEKREIARHQYVLTQSIRKLYTTRWNGPHPPGSPMLDKAWRQLDVMAPFEILIAHLWRMSNEIAYLMLTLSGNFGPMWEQIPPWNTKRYSKSLHDWLGIFKLQRTEFLSDVMGYRNINWVRLGIEERLHQLGEPNMFEEEKMFLAPSLLSQNHALFQDWLDHLTEVGFEAWFLAKAVNMGWAGTASTFWPDLTARYKAQFRQPYTIPTLGFERAGKRRRRGKISKKSLRNAQKRDNAKRDSQRSGLPAHQASNDTKSRTPATNGSGLWATKKFFNTRPVSESRRPYSTGPTITHESLRDRSPTLVDPEIVNARNTSLRSQEEVPLPDNSSSQEIDSAVNQVAPPLYWSHASQRGPDGQKLVVHYCRTLDSTEQVARLFLDSKVIGFDMEWKAQASALDTIQNNLSLIQIANEERIALFQIALFKPARTLQDLVAPSLKRVLESTDIIKVGVSIKADSTRLRKFLGIDSRSIFELSYLHKLVKHGQNEPKLVNKRAVNLSDQMEEHFGLPLEKSEDVRCGDWTRALNYRQVQYAATDPYACLCLFKTMEQKRQAMNPVPPRPAPAELNLPIVLPHGQAVNNEDKEPASSGLVDVVLDRS
ncbi:uncharacterized protein N7459_006866 [Penicillium hispanicum]|uniref:uncharacterized protein n=1 Tax=Penicillium hispanicum TaxID=1080232 RepID=UPI0025422A7D|nr:uncharacterized protein N7459_006866 [Penicillium hispanicum]KAJ5577902.1 hypothetical protein N7459_006866 [Penicillium hispanicum]